MYPRMNIRLLFLLLLIITGKFTCIFANPKNADAYEYQKAYNYILEEQWKNAYQTLSAFIESHREKSSPYNDDARFWRCYALDKMGEDKEKVYKCYETFIREHQDSEWADDARSHLIEVGQRLVKMGKTEYGALIKSMQNSDDKDIAMTAIMALSNMGDEHAADAMITLYDGQNDYEVKEKIIYTLSEMQNEKAYAKLMDIARSDKNPEIRKKSVFWLGENARDEKILKLLETIALTDSDRNVREHAVFAISEAPDQRGMPILMKIVQSETDAAIREKAVFWLGENATTDEMIRFLESLAINDTDQNIREHALYALSEVPDRRGLPALMHIAEKESNHDVREKAIFWIGENAENEEVIQFLKKVVMEDPDLDIREKALFGLSQLPDGQGLSLLIDIAQTSNDTEIREKAVFWLGENGHSEEIVNVLESIANSDPDSQLQEKALFALAEMPEQRGLPALIRIAKSHNNQSMRKKAIFWLGETQDPRAKDALLEIINQSK